MFIRTIPAPLAIKDIRRFASKVKINPTTNCHEWQGSLNGGYGAFYINRTRYPAHRVAYVLANGEPAPGMVVDHMCRNRRCVNKDHLRELTPGDNVRFGDAGKHNKSKLVCPRGHALAGINLIESLKWAGRACRACDIAARAARHKGLKGIERELFIQMRADKKYLELLEETRTLAAA